MDDARDVAKLREDGAFVAAAIRRKKLFIVLSAVGVVVGLGLGVWWTLIAPPASSGGLHIVLVVLVLLNARQNLRQYRYACALERREPSPLTADA